MAGGVGGGAEISIRKLPFSFLFPTRWEADATPKETPGCSQYGVPEFGNKVKNCHLIHES